MKIIQISIIILAFASIQTISSDSVKPLESSFIQEPVQLAKGLGTFYVRVKIGFKELISEVKGILAKVNKFQHKPETVLSKLGQILNLVRKLEGFQKSRRNKRDISALFSLGLGVYNRMDLSSVHASLRQLDTNQKTLDQNTHILAKQVEINSKAINSTMDAVERALDRNALVQDELKVLEVNWMLQEDIKRLQDLTQALSHIQKFRKWKDCQLSDKVYEHLGQSTLWIAKRGYTMIMSSLEDAPMNLIRVPTGGIEILIQFPIYKELWKVYQYVPLGSKLVDMEKNRIATDQSKTRFLTFSGQEWATCTRVDRIALCPSLNHDTNKTDCLTALFKHQSKEVTQWCALRPSKATNWTLEVIMGNDAFIMVQTPQVLRLVCQNGTTRRQLSPGGYQISLQLGCDSAKIGSWSWNRLGSVMETEPLETLPSLLSTDESVALNGVVGLERLHLARPTPIVHLMSLNQVETEFTLSWQWILVISLLSLAVVALVVAYLVYRFRKMRVGVAKEVVGSKVGEIHQGVDLFNHQLKDLI